MTSDFEMLLRAQHLQNMTLTGDPDYLERQLPFYRKAWEEAAEMLVHIGDYWWKAQTVDVGQVQMEVVDIFHFIIGEVLNTYGPAGEGATVGASALENYTTGNFLVPNYSIDGVDNNGFRALFVFAIEDFITRAIRYGQRSPARRGFDLNEMILGFTYLMNGAQMNIATVRLQYAAKFALNMFRQHNGYRDGSYVKLWDGKNEDNVFLQGSVQQMGEEMVKLPFAQQVLTFYDRIAGAYAERVLRRLNDTFDEDEYKAVCGKHMGLIHLQLAGEPLGGAPEADPAPVDAPESDRTEAEAE